MKWKTNNRKKKKGYSKLIKVMSIKALEVLCIMNLGNSMLIECDILVFRKLNRYLLALSLM